MKKLYELRKKIQGFAKDKPGYNYKYFNINQMVEEVQPEAEKLGLFITQPIRVTDGEQRLETIIWDMEDEKEYKMGEMKLPVLSDPQAMGGMITYYRRYMLQSVFFWGAFDDDGDWAKNKASEEFEKIKAEVDKAATKEEMRALYEKYKGRGKEVEQYIVTKGKEIA